MLEPLKFCAHKVGCESVKDIVGGFKTNTVALAELVQVFSVPSTWYA